MLRSSVPLFAVLILLLAGIAQGQEFSADVRATDQGTPMTKAENGFDRIYMSKARIRVEGENPSHRFVYIVDGEAGWELNPDAKTYMANPELAVFIRALVLPHNVDAMCRIMFGVDATCRMTGRDRVQGRPAVKVFFGEPHGNPSYFWIDEKLGVLLKYAEVRHLTSATQIIQLVNFREGRQPDDLFKVPADYRQVAPSVLREKPAETGSPDPAAEPHQ